MKKFSKKIFSVLLAAMMLFSVFAISASAEEATSGYYTYTVDENGNATITDVDYSISGDITIPSNLDGYPVTAIGADAFAACDDITGIAVPDTVESIGYKAFAYSDIEKIDLGSNMKEIGNQAFYQCYSLSTIHIPASVETIGDYAFAYCGMTDITVDPENEYYSVDEYGVLFNKDKTELIKYTSYNERTSYDIPESVELVEKFSFINSFYLTKVTMGDNVTTIGAGAFCSCANITELEIGKNVSLIGDEAFAGCDALTKITIPKNVVYLGTRAFSGCYNLSDVTICEGVADIGSYAFMYCQSLESIDIPGGVKYIGENAFSGCEKLTTINISDDVENISGNAFDYTAYYDNSTNWINDALYVGNHLVCANKEEVSGAYIIKDGTVSIAKEAFSACEGLTGVAVPETIKKIPDDAFESCINLTEITLPDTLVSIGESAFSNTAYANDTSNWEDGALYIDEYLIDVAETVSGDFSIKEGTKVVADDAFSGCEKITSISIPATTITVHAVNACASLEKIAVNENNPYYIADDNGVLFNKDKTILIKYPSNSAATEYVVPDSVTEIGDLAFCGCFNLRKLILTDGVESAGMLAFLMGDAFEFIHIPSSLHSLGLLGFYCINENVYICSDSEDCYAKTYADENDIEFKLCDGHGLSEPDTPDVPDEPNVPAVVPEIIPTPTEATISYGDSIILHAEASKIPEGGYVEWTASNGNFSYSVSDDGLTCRISPKSSGTTEFTATVYDANGNAVSTDTQQMTSKAGFFNKLIAFFKKLFGLTKVIPQVLRIFK